MVIYPGDTIYKPRQKTYSYDVIYFVELHVYITIVNHVWLYCHKSKSKKNQPSVSCSFWIMLIVLCYYFKNNNCVSVE